VAGVDTHVRRWFGWWARRAHRADLSLRRVVGRDNAGLLYDGYSGLLLVAAFLGLASIALEVRLFGSLTWSLAVEIAIWVAFGVRTAILTKRDPWGKHSKPRDPGAPSKGHKDG